MLRNGLCLSLLHMMLLRGDHHCDAITVTEVVTKGNGRTVLDELGELSMHRRARNKPIVL